jgi:hypothetical protein
MSLRPLPLLLLALTLAACSSDSGREWEEFDFDTETDTSASAAKPQLYEVPLDGERRLTADLDVGFGHVRLGRATAGQLVQAEMTVGRSALEPTFAYSRDGDTGSLVVGLAGEGSLKGGSHRWDLRFSDQVPLALSAELGMANADLDLSGLRLTDLHVEAGMAEATVRFEQPNREVLELIELSAGMAEFRARGLGHAQFERLLFEGGAGRFLLDFRGEALVPGAVAELELGVASAEIVLPEGHPVVIEAEQALGSVDVPVGFIKRGEGVWHSESVGRPEDALIIRAEVGAGSLRFRTE